MNGRLGVLCDISIYYPRDIYFIIQSLYGAGYIYPWWRAPQLDQCILLLVIIGIIGIDWE